MPALLINYMQLRHFKYYIKRLYKTSYNGYKLFIRTSKVSSKNICNEISKKKNQRPAGGRRYLIEESDIFKYNNWDNVEWDEAQEEDARQKVSKNSEDKVGLEKCDNFESNADKFWDDFYGQHQNRFFKDRHWLFTEFPELASQGKLPENIPEKAACASASNTLTASHPSPSSDTDNALPSKTDRALVPQDGSVPEVEVSLDDYPGKSAAVRIFEVGCGVGNTVFPVLQTNNDPELFVYCCDLSTTAIQLVKDHHDYKGGRCHAFVCNVADPESSLPFPPQSLDLVVLIFVMSAIHPDKMQQTIDRLASCLKPGGTILFRDYGRYDLAQLRFKNGQCLSDNFYVRGDGTRVYFFTQEELRVMFQRAGLEEVQNLIDRRLQVNRGRQLKMYRVWIQCKYRKPLIGTLS